MLIILGGIYFVPPLVAGAATDTVTNCNNSGTGSLRQTVADAAAGDIINFAMSPACSTIDDPTGTILITKNVTIDGPGASALAISGENAVGIFYVYSGVTASISGFTIENASVSSGGGIYNSGTLTVSNSTLSSDTAGVSGGAIYNSGSLTVSNSTLSSNSAPTTPSAVQKGGAIFSTGTLTVSNSTLSGNSAFSGGAIYNGGGTATISDSTLSDNTVSGYAEDEGGGIYNTGMLNVTASTLSGNIASPDGYDGSTAGGGILSTGSLEVSNSTFSGNNASVYGSGIYGSGTVSNSTFWANSGNFGGIYGTGSGVNVRATILAESSCGGTVIDQGYNIDTDGSCGFTLPSISDYTTLSRTLGPLANNGGPTQTIALLPANPAIDYVTAADCPATDQRGVIRTPPCDIGAYDTDGTPTTQTIAGHIYLCASGTQTTTEETGGTLGATGPQTVPTQANPLSPTDVTAGTYTMTATAPSGFQLVTCGSVSNNSTQSVVVPSNGAGVGTFYVTATSNALTITTTSLPIGTVSQSYPTTTLTATGGNPPYTWKLVKGSGKLPNGLKLSKHTGVISGTPKRHDSGKYSFTVEVLDTKVKTKHQPTTQNTAAKSLSITIS